MEFRKLRGKTAILLAIGAAAVLSGCDSGGASAPAGGSAAVSGNNPGGEVGTPPPQPQQRAWSTDAMVFGGSGAWTAEVGSIENILTSHGATFQEVSSAQLDAMGPSDMAKFGEMIFPGGSGGTQAQSVSATTHANLRAAVQQLGVNYVGFCAGAFVAVAPAPSPGGDVSYGFGIVNGPVLDYYTLENQGVDHQMTLESFPDGSTMNLLWYGGPVTPNTGVIAKYPTGEPAISEMRSGKGYVIISGVHPTATQAILDSLGMTPDVPQTEFAWKLFNAALHQQSLPTF